MSNASYSAELFQQAVREHQQERLVNAESLYRQVLFLNGHHPDANHLLGIILAEKQAFDESIPMLRLAVSLRPQEATFHHNLGETLRRAGDLRGALNCFGRAVRLLPQFAEAHYCAGNALYLLDQPQKALAAFRTALRADPKHYKASFNLANILREQGYVEDSIQEYNRALQIRPNYVDAMVNLACAYQEQHNVAEALRILERAEHLEPARTDIKLAIAQCCEKTGDFERAADVRKQSQLEDPTWALDLRIATALKPLPESCQGIERDRARITSAVAARLGRPVNVAIDELHSSGIEPPMALTYQGLDDRPLREHYAELFRPIFPTWEAPGSGQLRLHVGVLTTHGHEGVFVKCMRGLLERLPREQYRITVACSPLGRNFFRQEIKNSEITYLVLPLRIDQAAEVLRDARFDVLLYWEIGTDSTNYFLPFYRLAPLQCTTFGFPVTSGISSVDYFISSDELEPPNSDSHYSEQLLRLPTLPTYYFPPKVPPLGKTRSDFGLGDNQHIYFCGQRFHKFHPDFDELVAEILRRDPLGRFVCIGDREPFMDRLWRLRLQSTAPDICSRVQVVEWLEYGDYLQLTALADVVLDTPHYGGGANTIYDAIAVGKPIVSTPGRFQRGKYATAVNRRLGLNECIAASPEGYVNTALRLALEDDLAAEVSSRIVERRNELFEDVKYVTAFQENIERLLCC